jgi:hypothetical protein
MKDVFQDTLHLLRKSWLVFIKHFKSFFLIGGIFFCSYFVFLFGLALKGVMFGPALNIDSRFIFFLDLIVKIILFGGFSLWSLFYNAVIIKMVAYASKDEVINLKVIFSQVKSFFVSFLLVFFLVFFKVLLWSLLFIIPGIIFSFFYAFSQFSFVLDCKEGKEALVASRRLVQLNFTDFIFKYMAIFILVSGIYIVVRLCSKLIPGAGIFLSFFVQLFLSMYLTIFIYQMYQDYKDKDLSEKGISQESIALEST